MERVKKIFLFLLILIVAIKGIAQLSPVYNFQQDDSVLKKSYYEQALQKQNNLIKSLAKEDKDDYKEIYGDRFKEIGNLLQSSRSVTSPEAHAYLQAILMKVTDANPELKGMDMRVIFSRDWWPNAFSMGEGTIVINAGLVIFLNNEAELAFILCHELAHYYLDHGNKAIKKYVEKINDPEFRKELKSLSKQEYRVNQRLETLAKTIAFSSRKHSRENEAEADFQGFRFMKKTGYDCGAIITSLKQLDKMDDSSLFKALNPEQIFNFPQYPFKKKWIQKESSIFSMVDKDDSPLSKKEKDSLKTHPDCGKRIALLADSIPAPGKGNRFLVNEKLFNQLKKDFFIEMTEQEYRDKNLTRNLYYNLLLLQNNENVPFAVYSVARCLNELYENQKNHTIGKVTEPEDRHYPNDYNLFLRMIGKLWLDEIAALNYYFCEQFQEKMTGYVNFKKEFDKAKKNNNL